MPSKKDRPFNRPEIPSPREIAELPPDGGEHWNRLIFEQSPYLLQHAANPVDWYPWGEEAFKKAREEDKPIFLSVGYATCHWCHVMEHESFEDPEIARLMNEAFVCIKVDREERPDIDHVYMTVTQALTGSGGWPMTVIMTPEQKPFFAGTYFPPSGRYGRAGMRDIIPHIQKLWKEDRARAIDSADQIVSEIQNMTGGFAGGALAAETLERAVAGNAGRFDDVYGGFGTRPKFPVPHNLMFLMRAAKRDPESPALAMAEKTLTAMRHGGIYDHVGFGFHRYSTDEQWLLPHFEKMLYDQALMAMAYTEAWQITGDPLYRQTAEEILAYVARDMTSPEGGFYSAEDADSEGEEGKFYVWTREEIISILGEEEGRLYADVYTIKTEGNFRDESTGQPAGTNIPHLEQPLDVIAREKGIPESSLRGRLEKSRRKLFAVREKRIHPLKDDKILTDWNGLMIAAQAKAAKAFGNDEYANAARRAADFLLSHLRHDDGRLIKRYRNGHAGLPAHLEDYAFVLWGLIELYEASFDVRYLAAADEIASTMIDLFADEKDGGFFQTTGTGAELILRSKDIFDGAIPSGNSVAAYALLRLAKMKADARYEEHARSTFTAFSGIVANSPSNFSMLMNALDFAVGPTREIVIAGDAPDELARVARERFLPRAVLLHRPADTPEAILRLAPYLENNTPVNGQAAAYVCRDYTCQQPVTTPGDLEKSLAD